MLSKKNISHLISEKFKDLVTSKNNDNNELS